MKYIGTILLILLFPVLIIGALYLWRKRAAMVKTTTGPSGQGNQDQQLRSGQGNAGSTAADVAKVVDSGTAAVGSLTKLFAGLIPSNDYTPDSSEISAATP